MLHKIALLTVLVSPFSGFGQLKIDPKNEIFGGGSKILTKGSIDWSLGGSISLITLVSKNEVVYTTGFLQGVSDPASQFKVQDNFEYKFQLGPNPFTQQFWIGLQEANLTISKIVVLNNLGQIVYKIEGPFSGLRFSQNIELGSVNTGNYYLLIYYVVGDLYSKIKIIPISKI
jgi:hypothetical protein